MKSPSGVIGAVALVAIVVVAIFSTSGHKGTGAKGPPVGSQTPPFAAPLAVSKLNGDVNITPTACDVNLPGAFESCGATKKGPMVVGFASVDDKECAKLLPSLNSVAAGLPGITSVMVGLRGDRKPLAKLALAGPQVTTVWDHSGTLANRYGIAVCPTVVVVNKGGVVAGTLIGSDVNDPKWLQSQVMDLTSESVPIAGHS